MGVFQNLSIDDSDPDEDADVVDEGVRKEEDESQEKQPQDISAAFGSYRIGKKSMGLRDNIRSEPSSTSVSKKSASRVLYRPS